jgi:starch synthase
MPMRVLYVSTEVHPVLKTGGLADVNAALPRALALCGIDIRLLVPAFPAFRAALPAAERVATLPDELGIRDAALLRDSLHGVPIYLVDAPALYDRPGNPYVDEQARDWPDNALRFALLARIAARFADGAVDGFCPDVVHGHDWHAGLVPAYLAARGGARPASVFTIHNLSYQGHFPATTFASLQLPEPFFSMHGVEFHGGVNFMKAGLHYADRVTTVSPTYAREIQHPAGGFGMDGVLRSRAGALSGILNGIDTAEWNPTTDAHIAVRYTANAADGKLECRKALRRELGLAVDAPGPLCGVVSRLTPQKGLDLVLAALPTLLQGGGQLVVLGSGDAPLESAYRDAGARYPGALSVRLGYDEMLAHRIIAGSDIVLVPSRFEPCGLTQMYGLAYGAIPLVHRVGGLADTVRDADPAAIAAGTATGIVFDAASVPDLERALTRALDLWRKPVQWARVRAAGMREQHGWGPSAARYAALYRELRPHVG